MHLVEIFQYILLFVTTVFTLNVYDKYKKSSPNQYTIIKDELPIIAVVISLILMFGLRPTDDYWFADSYWYNRNYWIKEGDAFTLRLDAINLIWDNLFDFFCSYKLGISNLFLLADTLYFGCTYLACRKMFGKHSTAAYLVFLGAFSTFSYSYNGIKAGVAASLFILAMAYYDKLYICAPLVLISWGFHHSMQLPVAAFVLSFLYRNSKVYFAFWAICVFLALAHITYFQDLFAEMTDEKGAGYLMGKEEDWGGNNGFRLDFIIYSAAPVYLGYKATFKKKLKLSKQYIALLNIYLITNSIWMLCMYANFTNRIAYLSWFLYPIVLIYPIINENWGAFRYKTFSKIIAYHLSFTLFMELIYYKLIK